MNETDEALRVNPRLGGNIERQNGLKPGEIVKNTLVGFKDDEVVRIQVGGSAPSELGTFWLDTKQTMLGKMESPVVDIRTNKNGMVIATDKAEGVLVWSKKKVSSNAPRYNPPVSGIGVSEGLTTVDHESTDPNTDEYYVVFGKQASYSDGVVMGSRALAIRHTVGQKYHSIQVREMSVDEAAKNATDLDIKVGDSVNITLDNPRIGQVWSGKAYQIEGRLPNGSFIVAQPDNPATRRFRNREQLQKFVN